MPIESIRISGFRGYGSEQIINIAVPDGNVGSGLSIIVGPNNGGKSTIIEALKAMTSTNISFSEDKRNIKTDYRVDIRVKFKESTSEFHLKTSERGGSETEFVNKELFKQNIFVLPSRRYFDPYFSKNELSRTQYVSNTSNNQLRGSRAEHFFGRLFTINKDPSEFNKLLAEVLSPVPNWYIEQAGSGQYFLKFKFGDSSHNSEGLGEGIVSLFFIIDALYDSSPDDIIIIDEPELSLHPYLQRKLLSTFKRFSKDRQIIYATHSPYFIDFDSILNGASISRVFKINHEINIKPISEQSIKIIKSLNSDLNNPHLLGLDTKEVFFLEDKVILTEGQEDVLFYDKILNQIGCEVKGDFMGWGVGGAEKMELFANILSDLGFKKVVGILDGDKSEVFKKLQSQYKYFHFALIPAQDIRDKKAVPAKLAKEGLLDGSLKLKDNYRKELEKIFSEINSYLD